MGLAGEANFSQGVSPTFSEKERLNFTKIYENSAVIQGIDQNCKFMGTK
jgi:hypothetical protein